MIKNEEIEPLINESFQQIKRRLMQYLVYINLIVIIFFFIVTVCGIAYFSIIL